MRKQLALIIGLGLALVAQPAAAQTRVSVALGFGVPRPYVSGVVIVGQPRFYRPYLYRPYLYHPYFNRPPIVVVVARPYPVRPVFVERVVVPRGKIHRHHHHRDHYYDRDGDYDDE